MGSVLESTARQQRFDSLSRNAPSKSGVGSKTRFQISLNCSNVRFTPSRRQICSCQSRGDMRPSCQSRHRGSCSMAAQVSGGGSELFPASPPIAPGMWSRTSTRPMSKMMARIFLGARFLDSNGLRFFDYRRFHCGVALRVAAFAKNADHRGKQRNHHYHRDYIMNFLSNIRNRPAQQIATQNHAADPQDPAKNIVRNISRIRHSRGACYGRTERTDDGHEAREDYRLPAVFFIKRACAMQMTGAKEKRLFTFVQ